jgi:hypothetical protein
MSETQESPERIEVWLVADADDHRAMHDMIALYDGDSTMIFESVGWKPERPVDRVLAAAGFRPGEQASPIFVRECSCEVPIVRLRGFSAPASQRAEVEMMIRMAMAGNLGGFWPVVAGQTGFHRVQLAFEYVWAAAGRPPIRLRHPEHTGGQDGGDEGPSPIDSLASRNERIAATLRLAGEDSEEAPPEGDLPIEYWKPESPPEPSDHGLPD